MLSLRELERAAEILSRRLDGHRVQSISQPDAHTLVLGTYGGEGDERGRLSLLLSCRPGSARVSLGSRPRGAPAQPPAFQQYLRAHVQGARIDGFAVRDGDRQLSIRLRAREGDYELLLAILGRRSNAVLLDGADRLVAAMRPLADTRPELAIGEPWRSPSSKPPTAGEDRFAEVPDESFLEEIEAHYAGVEREGRAGSLRQRLEQALRKEGRATLRKLEKLDRELSAARDAARFEREGELLKSVLPQVRRGDAEAVARDWSTGEEVRIALDPAKSPAENLQRLFKRYQKAVRGLAKGGAQREAVAEAHAGIEELLAELASIDADDEGSLPALEALAERPPVRRLLAKYAPAPPRPPGSRGAAVAVVGRREVPARLAPRRFRSSTGLEIWVGRSDAGNDYLSTRLARGNDLFFHLDGAPGSHVVLRTEGRTDPPAEAVLEACELAVHYSKFKNASRADVHVVPIKNVRKPKGAKPGLVVVHGGKTVHLRREDARLERVLASRVED